MIWKALKVAGILFLLLILLRGVLFRLTVHYQPAGERPIHEISHEKLLERIREKAAGRDLTLKQIARISNTLTRQTLSFTLQQASDDPNVLIETKKANCVGYAAMFAAIANHLAEHHAQSSFKVRHLVGQMDFLGTDLHQFFKSSFFKDHDYNQLIDPKSGKVISIDPSISDYLGIDRIRSTIE